VRLIWTREDDITGGRYRPLNYHRVTAAIGKDGKVAYRQRVVGQSIIIGTPFEAMMVKNGVDRPRVGGSAAEQYDLADAHISWSQPRVGVPVLWWRSVENTHMAFSKEVMIDELAHAAGQERSLSGWRCSANIRVTSARSSWRRRRPDGTRRFRRRRGAGAAWLCTSPSARWWRRWRK